MIARGKKKEQSMCKLPSAATNVMHHILIWAIHTIATIAIIHTIATIAILLLVVTSIAILLLVLSKKEQSMRKLLSAPWAQGNV